MTKNSHKKFHITVFNKSPQGLESAAFAAFSPHYILNVVASKMSSVSLDEDDFVEFLRREHPQILEKIGKSGFAPRQIYGEYLQDIWQKTLQSDVDLNLVNQEVVSVEGDKEFVITTKDNQKFFADEVVLATSFFQSELPWKIESKNLIKNLWGRDALDFHQKKFTDEKICLIGSGLTTVDIIVGLKNKNFGGKIFVISRRGNFPKKHFVGAHENPNFISVSDAKKGVLFLCLKVRKFLRSNSQFDLRHVVDSVRPITKDLWHNFDEKNKKLFLRLLPYWNIFRHRAPANSIQIIEDMIAAGQLQLCSGGVKEIVQKYEKFVIKTKTQQIETDYLVNCLGFEFNAKKYPLLNQMMLCNLLTQDLMMVRSNNKNIHLLGGLNIGRDFECTSVPDLRVDVEKLTSQLCKN